MEVVDRNLRVRQRRPGPRGVGADRSTTVPTAAWNSGVCSASQLFTQAPERPGARPSSSPRREGSASTNDVSQRSKRFQPGCLSL